MVYSRGKVDTKEFELPDTHLISDIEDSVFQSIILKSLSKIKGISLLEGTIIDSILGREEVERVKGIYVDQEGLQNSVNVKVEVNIGYGIPLPAKAEEIQNLIIEEITKLTGLHVGSVHVVFKNIVPEELLAVSRPQLAPSKNENDEYTDDF